MSILGPSLRSVRKEQRARVLAGMLELATLVVAGRGGFRCHASEKSMPWARRTSVTFTSGGSGLSVPVALDRSTVGEPSGSIPARDRLGLDVRRTTCALSRTIGPSVVNPSRRNRRDAAL